MLTKGGSLALILDFPYRPGGVIEADIGKGQSMKLASVAIATSFVVTAGLVWYVNAANGYAFMRTASDAAVFVVLGVVPWLLALRKSVSDTTDSGAWVFSVLSLAAGLILLGSLPSGDAVSFHSALLLAAAWGSYALSRLLGLSKQNMEQ